MTLWNSGRRVLAVAIMLSAVAAAQPGCDVTLLRTLSRAAQQAHPRQQRDEQARLRYDAAMRRLLALHRQGCALPADDPDSVVR